MTHKISFTAVLFVLFAALLAGLFGIQNALPRDHANIDERRAEVQSDLGDRQQIIQDRAQERTENLETRRVEQEEKVEERRAKLSERAQDRIEAYVERIVRRLNAAVDRLARITGRIEERIEDLEERGLNLSVAREKLVQAKADLGEASDLISGIDGALENTLDSENPRESFGAVRELVKSSIAGVKAAHRALVDVIIEVKAGISTRTDITGSEDTDDDSENNGNGTSTTTE